MLTLFSTDQRWHTVELTTARSPGSSSQLQDGEEWDSRTQERRITL
jgi:hypothetical protein